MDAAAYAGHLEQRAINMRYLPHTEADIEEMLKAVGAGSLDALFAQIPENSRRSIPQPA